MTPSDPVPLLVVDAANVIGSRPDGWWRDRAGAARRLLAGLTRYAEEPDHPTELVVVLEGAARAAADVVVTPPLRVVLAPASGDDTIVEVVSAAAASGRPITVVTADRALRTRVENHGATTTGPRWLLDQLP